MLFVNPDGSGEYTFECFACALNDEPVEHTKRADSKSVNLLLMAGVEARVEGEYDPLTEAHVAQFRRELDDPVEVQKFLTGTY